jgi:hypothetical protein
MADFKSTIAADVDIFYNEDEFAESATYNGEEITVVEDEATERNTGSPGFVNPLYRIFVPVSSVARPEYGDVVVFRDVNCLVGAYPVSNGQDWLIELFKETVQI